MIEKSIKGPFWGLALIYCSFMPLIRLNPFRRSKLDSILSLLFAR